MKTTEETLRETILTEEQITRVRDALEDVTSLIDSLRIGCEIAYRREPTQAEGDAHEHQHEQSMGASYGAGECFVPMGGHHGWRCKCGKWVWGGPTVCQRCVDKDAVKIAIHDLPGDEDFIRLPGLFRRWELNDVIELGADFHLEDAGEVADGTQLIAVYRRERRSPRSTTTDSSSTTNPNKKEQ